MATQTLYLGSTAVFTFTHAISAGFAAANTTLEIVDPLGVCTNWSTNLSLDASKTVLTFTTPNKTVFNTVGTYKLQVLIDSGVSVHYPCTIVSVKVISNACPGT